MTLTHRIPKLKNELRDVVATVNKADDIILVSGNNPDGDSIGTLIALKQFCEEKGKTVHGFCVTDLPENLNFLDTPDLITDYKHIPDTVDTIITFDLGQLSQTGLEDWIEKVRPTIINIDHHKTNDKFGHINVVYTESSSAAELVYNLFLNENILLSKQSSTGLLTGLINDTGNLSNPATSASALAMAAHLVRTGGKLNAVVENTYKNKSLPALNLWGEIIENLHHNETYGVTIAVVSQEHLNEYNADDEWLEGLANFLTVLGDGTKAIMVLRERNDGIIKGSMRTTHNDIDLEKLARILGGGGHKKASGFDINGTLAKKNSAWYIQ